MKKMLMLAFTTLCLLAILTACGQKNTGKEGQTGKEDDPAPQEQTISGTVNRLEDYLVLVDGEGAYHVFDFGEDVDPDSLSEGDDVTVTYTGTLDSEDPAPVATAVEKEA